MEFKMFQSLPSQHFIYPAPLATVIADAVQMRDMDQSTRTTFSADNLIIPLSSPMTLRNGPSIVNSQAELVA